jgi:hypothetical protein
MSHFTYCYAECRYAKCRNAECRYAECRYAECCNDECRYAGCRYEECRGATKSTCYCKMVILNLPSPNININYYSFLLFFINPNHFYFAYILWKV